MCPRVVSKLKMEVVVAFKAGKLTLEGKTLQSDPRKGLLRVGQSEEGLVHVEWLPRDGDAMPGAGPYAEDDMVVFPQECRLEQASLKGEQDVMSL